VAGVLAQDPTIIDISQETITLVKGVLALAPMINECAKQNNACVNFQKVRQGNPENDPVEI
jgi:hypothetical protein